MDWKLTSKSTCHYSGCTVSFRVKEFKKLENRMMEGPTLFIASPLPFMVAILLLHISSVHTLLHQGRRDYDKGQKYYGKNWEWEGGSEWKKGKRDENGVGKWNGKLPMIWG